MRAIVKTERQYGGVSVVDLPIPDIADDEVLVRVNVASICGSDVHLYKYSVTHHFVNTPIIMGHEYAGVVEKVGPNARGVSPGDFVAIEAVDYCGRCGPCLHGKKHLCKHFAIAGMHRMGGFAEYAVVRAHLLHPLPLDYPMDRASWVEPTSVVVHAVEDRSRISNGDIVLVTGPGPIGLLAAQVAKAKGATVIVAGADSDEEMRLPIARSLGMHTVNLSTTDTASFLRDEFERDSVDWAIECSGASQVVEPLLNLVEKGTGVTFIGLFAHPVEIQTFTGAVRKELDLLTSFSSTWNNYEAAIRLLYDGVISVEGMTTFYDVDRAVEAFEDTVARTVLKPVFRF